MQSIWVGSGSCRERLAVLSIAAAALLGAACGDDDGGGSGAPAAMPPAADAATPGGGSTGSVTPDAGSPNQQSPQDAGSTPTDGGASDAAAASDASAPGASDAGTYFAEVTANGTGCPAGSWTTQLSPDNQSFTIAFTRYDAEVTPQSSSSIKDCQLAIKLRSRQPVSYAVQSFAFDGYAKLESGVRATLSANYYFQGSPTNNVGQEVDVAGPYDRPFSFRQNVALPQQVWSACAIERDLNLTSRVVVRNGSPAASGRVNIAQSSGGPQLFVALAQRACP